jgi:5-methylthioadenosine/S-adenosylhomocysteine deaminase
MADTWAILDTTILPHAGGSPIAGVDLVIAGGRIMAMGPREAAAWPHAERLDGTRLLVIPGLINAHNHSAESLRRGVATGGTLEDWLADVWGVIDRLGPDELRVAVLLGAVEMVKRGTTAVLDHFRQRPVEPWAIDAAVEAYEEIGLRAVIAPMVRDIGVDGAPPAAEQLAVIGDALARHEERELVTLGVGPSGAGWCSDRLLLDAAVLAASHSACFHLHVNETEDQARDSHARFGVSTVRRLNDLGVLGPRTSLAHVVWIDADDIALLAATGTIAVHNPASNLRLGSGQAPVAALRRAGATVALGTDGAASNDGQDMFEAMKLAVLASRSGAAARAAWLQPADALAMATAAGRQALGLTPAPIAPGAIADLTLLDLDAPGLVPLNDATAQIALCGPGIAVRHVFVAGRPILRDGVLPHIDEPALYDAARAIARSWPRAA